MSVKNYMNMPGPQKKSAYNNHTEGENSKPLAVIVKNIFKRIIHAQLHFMMRSHFKKVLSPDLPEADNFQR